MDEEDNIFFSIAVQVVNAGVFGLVIDLLVSSSGILIE
jgi:hypothetical protein